MQHSDDDLNDRKRLYIVLTAFCTHFYMKKESLCKAFLSPLFCFTSCILQLGYKLIITLNTKIQVEKIAV